MERSLEIRAFYVHLPVELFSFGVDLSAVELD